MKILFATGNKNKLREIKQLLPELEIISFEDIQFEEEIPETSDTIKGNASIKSNYIYSRFKLNCFADDTGLEVESLNGAPGVNSARYASNEKDDEANMTKLLNKLEDSSNRKARFKTVISLLINGKEHVFEGIVEGKITEAKRGTEGFGYDPIFEPESCGKTFAEMLPEEKNSYSHRGRAIRKMVQFFNTNGIV